MKRFVFLSFLFSLHLSAQNWEAKLALHLPAGDEMLTNGIPTNSVVAFYSLGTNTIPHSPYIFVGDLVAVTNFYNARRAAYDNWKTNTWNPYFTAKASNELAASSLKLQEDRPRQIRVGTLPVVVGITSTNIVFDSPMVAANYVLFFNPNGLNTTISFTTRTLNGFTVTLTPGVNGTFAWMAVER